MSAQKIVNKNLIEEYRYCAANIASMTEQSYKLLYYYLVILGLFATAVSILLTQTSMRSEVVESTQDKCGTAMYYLAGAALLYALFLISRHIKYCLIKLRASVIEWVARINYLRDEMWGIGLYGKDNPHRALANPHVPPANKRNSIQVRLIRLIGIMVVFILAAFWLCVIHIVKCSILHIELHPSIAVAACSVIAFTVFWLERRYDYDSLAELEYYIRHSRGLFPEFRTSLTLSRYPYATIAMYGIVLSISNSFNVDVKRICRLLVSCHHIGAYVVGYAILYIYISMGLEVIWPDCLIIFCIFMIIAIVTFLVAGRYLCEKINESIEDHANALEFYVKYLRKPKRPNPFNPLNDLEHISPQEPDHCHKCYSVKGKLLA